MAARQAGQGWEGFGEEAWEGAEGEDAAVWPIRLAEGDGWEHVPESDRELGRLGEDLAVRFLESLGYRLIGRNYRTPFGEADVVLRDGEEVVLAEVKTRRGSEALPEEAVDGRKQSRYRDITLEYLREHREDELVRFDVVAVNVVSAEAASIHHFTNVCIWEG